MHSLAHADVASVLLMSGALLIYLETMVARKRVCVLAGAMMAMAGTAMLWRGPHSSLGLELGAAGLGAFLVEALVNTYYAGGVAGTVLLAFAFLQFGVSLPLALALAAVWGAGTTLMLSVCKRARENKRADL